MSTSHKWYTTKTFSNAWIHGKATKVPWRSIGESIKTPKEVSKARKLEAKKKKGLTAWYNEQMYSPLVSGPTNRLFSSNHSLKDGMQNNLILYWPFHKPKKSINYTWRYQRGCNWLEQTVQNMCYSWLKTSMGKSRLGLSGISTWCMVYKRSASHAAP